MKNASPARRNTIAAVALLIVLLAPMAVACALTPAVHTGSACPCCDHLQVVPGTSCGSSACSASHTDPVLLVTPVSAKGPVALHPIAAIASAFSPDAVSARPQTVRVGSPPGRSTIPLRI